MFKFNREELKDKIYACWIGKNMGGTIGGPYEGVKEMLDIQGFSTKKGSPLPNDDLDLQLIWLLAAEQHGPFQLNAEVLAEYWLTMIPPSWAEYGVAKANLRRGFAPPMSGEADNDKWKTSNGAWIRSEIWACLAPGYSGIARKYAFYDASVDHGVSEGTIAEIFTVTMECEAFVNSDIRAIIDIALANIPAESRVAKAVNLVIDCYEKGIEYRKTRELLVEQSADIGMFQAPANVGFTVLGLLYGEGDFKKSIIYAVNCGDDTDCTAGTVGATLGILKGTAGIPKDWMEYLGDDINTICINGHVIKRIPKTCTELTDRVLDMIPVMLAANRENARETTGKTEWPEDRLLHGDKWCVWGNESPHSPMLGKPLLDKAPYSYDISNYIYLYGRASFDRKPSLAEGESINLRFDWIIDYCSASCAINVFAPDGLKVEYDKNILVHGTHLTDFTMKFTAVKPLAARNDVCIAVYFPDHIKPVLIPLMITGK